jgi:phosphopantothenoylcysteine decarboxylase/phosphopantothenate--cysteine ligase
MGYALATAAVEAGAQVTIVSGPVTLDAPDRCTVIPVVSAADMHSSAITACADADVFIAAAAVADYRPVTVSEQKIKKQADSIEIELTKNPDIVSTVAESFNDLFVVGFAAETEDVETYARGKLARKKLNAIIANDVSRGDVGFNSDDNEAWWITSDNSLVFSKRSKAQSARDIVVKISEQMEG